MEDHALCHCEYIQLPALTIMFSDRCYTLNIRKNNDEVTMQGRIDTNSLITLINQFVKNENVKPTDDHLFPRIFQNSGGKLYVPPEVRDQINSDAGNMKAAMQAIPEIGLPMNDVRAANGLAQMLPGMKSMSQQISSALPLDALR